MAHLRFFASLREAAGTPAVDIPAATVAELIKKAEIKYGSEFAGLAGTASVAVNMVPLGKDKYEQRRLSDSDEVAMLPPVSGGEEQTLILESDRTDLLRAMALLGAILVASWLGSTAVASVLAAVSFLAALEMSRPVTPFDVGAPDSQSSEAGQPDSQSRQIRNLPVAGRVVVSASAAALPLATVSSGEGAVLWALWVAIVSLGIAAIRSGPSGATEMIGRGVWVVLFTGFLASFTAVLQAVDESGKVLMAFLLISALHRLGMALADRVSAQKQLPGLPGLSMKSGLAGLAGGLAAGGLSVLILPERYDLVPMLAVGLLTGVAASLSWATASLLQADIASGSRLHFKVLNALQPILLAGPAFYYSLRLYLT